jgi:hypothetical protein
MKAPTSMLTRAMVTGPVVFEEAQEWDDGRPTGKQRVNENGIPVWTVEGLAPEIALNGEVYLGTGEKVVIASTTPTRVDSDLGSWVSVRGTWKATKIAFGEMTGRADLEHIGGEE